MSRRVRQCKAVQGKGRVGRPRQDRNTKGSVRQGNEWYRKINDRIGKSNVGRYG